MPVTNAASGIKAGTVAYFAASSAPAGWLKANGALVSRSTYAALFNAIGTTYGAGDGSTTFAIPDLRGEFVRGLDDGRGVDAGRSIGSYQADELKEHDHNTWAGPGSGNLAYPQAGNTTPSDRFTARTGGSETRPRNVALLACIKF